MHIDRRTYQSKGNTLKVMNAMTKRPTNSQYQRSSTCSPITTMTWAEKMRATENKTDQSKEGTTTKKKKKKKLKSKGATHNFDEDDLDGLNVGHAVSDFVRAHALLSAAAGEDRRGWGGRESPPDDTGSGSRKRPPQCDHRDVSL
jgi:hypothetical protein